MEYFIIIIYYYYIIIICDKKLQNVIIVESIKMYDNFLNFHGILKCFEKSDEDKIIFKLNIFLYIIFKKIVDLSCV